MAYNPVVRGINHYSTPLGIPGASANTNLGVGGQANDQFSLQNMQPEDYLGTHSYVNPCH